MKLAHQEVPMGMCECDGWFVPFSQHRSAAIAAPLLPLVALPGGKLCFTVVGQIQWVFVVVYVLATSMVIQGSVPIYASVHSW